MSREQTLIDFFNAYASRFNAAITGNSPDLDGFVNSFADFFVGASPLGVNGGKNDENFRAQLPKGFAFYKSVGTQSMEIVTIAITLLDDLHAMVKVHWRSRNERKDKTKVAMDFDVFYFLQEKDGIPKIFAYVTGDEQKALQENGLLPS